MIAGEIRPHDVLFGRGGVTNNHVGNKRYRAIVAEHQHEYLHARKKDKVLIARRIVSLVHESGGRFLKRNNHGGSSDSKVDGESAALWVEVPDQRATEKTSQALREGLDVKNHTLRTGKMVRRISNSSDSTKPDSSASAATTLASAAVGPAPLHLTVSSAAVGQLPYMKGEYWLPLENALRNYRMLQLFNRGDLDHMTAV
jgi:hypothetical protein